MYYTTQEYSSSWAALVGEKETFGDKADKCAYLKYTDKVEHAGGGWFAGTYKWDRIQTIDDFIKGENRENIYHGAVLDVKISSKLTDEALTELKGKKWVLRFAETNYSLSSNYTTGATFESYTLVGDVTILRLKFETDGITYNLGAIDNKQTGSTEPSNSMGIKVEPNATGKGIIYLILFVLLLVLFAPLLPYVLNAIILIVSLPIKLVSEIIKLIKSSKKKRKDRLKKNEKD